MRDIIKTIVVSLGLTAFIVAISIDFFYLHSANWDSINCIICVLFVLFLVELFWLLWFRKKCKRQSVREIFDFLIPAVLFVSAIAKVVVSDQNLDKIHILANPGGIFAIIMGLVTVVGIFLAFQQIINVDARVKGLDYSYIISYNQLIDSLIEFVRKTENEIKIVSYFPLFGYWQVNENKRRELEQVMLDARDKIKFTCVKEEFHLKLLISIAEKGTNKYDKLNKDNIDKTAQRICEFQEKSYNVFLSQFARHRKLSYNEMPGYYIFVSKAKAILVTPIRLPYLSEMEISQEQLNNNGKLKSIIESHFTKMLPNGTSTPNNSNEAKYVETLGFETKDKNVIAMLEELADMYYNS